MSDIQDVEFVEEKSYNVLQLNGYEEALIGITHESKPRAIYSLSKIIDKIMLKKTMYREQAFKEFELEIRLPLLSSDNAPIYLNDITL